jgi:hypothetical protein
VSKSTKVLVKDIDKRETLAYMPSRQNSVVGGQKKSLLLCKSRDKFKGDSQYYFYIPSPLSTTLCPSMDSI